MWFGHAACFVVTPFQLSDASVVILKDPPISQCNNCGEYLLADQVMARIDEVPDAVDGAAELEVVRFAA